jgi:hypothetical protein
MESWPDDIALDTFRGMYADALHDNCPMGDACRLGGVAIEAEGSTEAPNLILVAECPIVRCPVDVVFGVAGAQAIHTAQEAGLISGGTLGDKS